MDKKQNYPFSQFLKDIWMFLAGQRFKFVTFLTIIFIAGLFGYISTYLLGKIVDFFIDYASGDSLRPFYLYTGAIVILGSLAVSIRQWAKLSLLKIGANMRRKVRLMSMNKLVDIELKWHEDQNTGAKIHKINNGSQNLYDAMRLLGNEGNDIIVGLGGTVVIFALLSWKYSLFALGYFLIFIFLHTYFMRKKSKWQERISLMNEKLSGKVHESASNILAVKSLGLKRSITTTLKSHEDDLYKTWLGGRTLDSVANNVFTVFNLISYALFIILLGYDASNGIIQATTIFVFASYFDRLNRATNIIRSSNDKVLEIKTGVGRVVTVLGVETVERETDNLYEVSDNWNEIVFKNISFRYKNRWVLKDFNFVIKRNEKIGLVGKSGCGKSTLAKLILGLYQPQEGEILIDGKKLGEYKQSSINSKISIVLQDSEMFNSSLSDNISIYDSKPNQRKINFASETSELNDIILKLPEGLKTLIGERGYKLSGGERQRVGIARALYKDSSMIILDEATSHLDSKTEERIQNNLLNNLDNKTLLVIAHRLSTLNKMDRIIVMQKGKIIEEGNFNQLLKSKGEFYELYKTQKMK